MSPWSFLGWLLVGLFLFLIIGALALFGLFGKLAFLVTPLLTLAALALPALLWFIISRWQGSPESSPFSGDSFHRKGEAGIPDGHMEMPWQSLLGDVGKQPLYLVVHTDGVDGPALVAASLPGAERIASFRNGPPECTLFKGQREAWLVVSPQISGLTGTGAAIKPGSNLAGQLFSVAGKNREATEQEGHGLAGGTLAVVGLAGGSPYGSCGRGWGIFLEALKATPPSGVVLLAAPVEVSQSSVALATAFAARLVPLQRLFYYSVPVWLQLHPLNQYPGGCLLCRPPERGDTGAAPKAAFDHAPQAGAEPSCLSIAHGRNGLASEGPWGSRLPNTRAWSVARSLPWGRVRQRLSPAAFSGSLLASVGKDFDALTASLTTLLQQCDGVRTGEGVALCRGGILVRRALEEARSALCASVEILARQEGNRLAGMSFSGETPTGGAVFTVRLFGEILPSLHGNALGRTGQILGRHVPRALILACAGLLLVFGIGGWRASGILDALDTLAPLIMEARPPQGERVFPAQELPVARYGRVTLELAEQERACAGFAAMYSAPAAAVARMQEQLARRIAARLPGLKQGEDDLGLWVQALAQWANEQENVGPLFVNSPRGNALVQIDGSATARGRAWVDELLSQWMRILPESDRARLRQVQGAYDARVFALWQESGEELLALLDSAATRPLAKAAPETGFLPHIQGVEPVDLLTAEAPNTGFIDAAARELAFSRSLDQTPAWVSVLNLVGDSRSLALLRGSARLSLTSLGGEGRWFSESVPQGGESGLSLQRLDLLFQAASAWNAYEKALSGLLPQAGTRQGQAQLATAGFAGAAGEHGVADFVSVSEARVALETRLALLEPLYRAEKGHLVRRLVNIPLDAVVLQSTGMAAKMVQDRWITEVVASLREIAPADMREALFGDGGRVLRFVNTTAFPFLETTAAGYAAATAFGNTFPFTEEFLVFLNDESVVPLLHSGDFPLTVQIRPVTTNAGATGFPRGVGLDIRCGEREYRAEAQNNRRSFHFAWEPKACNRLTLTIAFDAFTLVREYNGATAFTEFLRQAATGTVRFDASEFAGASAKLKGLGISTLNANFAIDGGEEFLMYLEDPEIPVPYSIIQ